MRSLSGISTAILAVTVVVTPVFANEPEASATAGSTATGDLLPPNAKAGECYARVYTPPIYKTEYEQVLKRAESESVSVIPAKFETVEETVLVRETSKRIEVIPATYEWAEEQVLVKPASTMLKQIPATYETVTEQVLEKPGYTYWKKGTGPKQKIDNATGEIMCLVEVPPVYRTVTKQVVKTSASVQEIEVPAQYAAERKRVMKTPPTTREVEVPAEYKTVKVTRLVEPAKEVRHPIPAQYQTVSKTVMAEDAKLEWRSILCDTNMKKGNVQKLQKALKRAGYNPGKIDGVLGKQTQQAIRGFQADRHLPSDAYVNMETVKALHVSY
ncbi:MAG: peptidoglycan-binding protein [Nitrospira sp.]|nr:peptidoglycan-binding protein [Nitrospira sp.]